MKFIKYIKYIMLMLLLLNIGITATAQVNGYAKVININDQSLTLSNVNESFGTFEAGDQIIIMQMQDDIIGANTDNDIDFGSINTIASTGLYEVATIVSMNELSGTPFIINLTTPLSNIYNIGANSSVQIITYPRLGSPNYTTTSDITAINWDGNIGGVVAFQVDGVLTLQHNITANGTGFRGGRANGGTFSVSGCGNAIFRTDDGSTGFKGESIYKNTTSEYVFGRAKLSNGGGGGSLLDAGGGGGSNFSAGGTGGEGFRCGSGTASGGLGGVDLSAYISGNRIFMGGGGGGGQINLGGTGGNGGVGGGIILVKANSLMTTGNCGKRIVSANGSNAGIGAFSGGGGGGGAGAIVLQVDNFLIGGTCPLAISANGGDGGNSLGFFVRGGGGGGGQGTVVFSATQPTTNVTVNTSPGAGGLDDDFGSRSSGNGDGIDGQGVLSSVATPLPIELLYFKAKLVKQQVVLDWATLTEKDNKFFEIQRSSDAVNWQKVTQVKGAVNSSKLLTYQYIDVLPLDNISYYRLKQVDLDGTFSLSDITSVNIKSLTNTTVVFPNPAQNQVFIKLENGVQADGQVKALLFNTLGIQQPVDFMATKGGLTGNIETLPEGVYLLKIYIVERVIVKKIVVRR